MIFEKTNWTLTMGCAKLFKNPIKKFHSLLLLLNLSQRLIKCWLFSGDAAPKFCFRVGTNLILSLKFPNFVNRTTADCSWMDPNMVCQDNGLSFTPTVLSVWTIKNSKTKKRRLLDSSLQQGWFGGDYLSIVGECECQYWMAFDGWELQCENTFVKSKNFICHILQ